ncbi:MAG: CheY-like chemotaxis protein [Methylophilaceae bacterium]|jgi:CheY-like chemotaxis protein
MIISGIRIAEKFKQTVLIVDDQTVALNINQAILEALKLNLNTVTMRNPVEALKWVKNKQIDLIATDFKYGRNG